MICENKLVLQVFRLIYNEAITSKFAPVKYNISRWINLGRPIDKIRVYYKIQPPIYFVLINGVTYFFHLKLIFRYVNWYIFKPFLLAGLESIYGGLPCSLFPSGCEAACKNIKEEIISRYKMLFIVSKCVIYSNLFPIRLV